MCICLWQKCAYSFVWITTTGKQSHAVIQCSNCDVTRNREYTGILMRIMHNNRQHTFWSFHVLVPRTVCCQANAWAQIRFLVLYYVWSMSVCSTKLGPLTTDDSIFAVVHRLSATVTVWEYGGHSVQSRWGFSVFFFVRTKNLKQQSFIASDAKTRLIRRCSLQRFFRLHFQRPNRLQHRYSVCDWIVLL